MKLLLSPWPMVHPITEQHYHVWKAAFYLLMLRVGSAANVLRLIAVLASNIPLNPLFPFSLLHLVSFILGMDLVEPAGAFLRRMVESVAMDPARQASA